MSEEQTARRKRRRAARQESEGVDVGSVPDARAPRHRRSAASRVFYSLFVIFALAGLTALALAAFGYQQYITPGPISATKVVEVRKGLRTPDIAADLEKAGAISDARVFTAAAYLTGSRGRLKAGEYEIPSGMSMRDVLGLIVQGKSIVYKLTIPEGWTTEQALERVRQNDILTGDLTLSPPEGALFPDTYLFRRGDTRDSVVENMMAAQQKLVAELWDKRAPELVVKSVNEAVTLASIVEKETGVAEERPRVAAVFVNRLKQRMRLQSDPTIIYGLVGGKSKLDRPLTKQDIAQKTPYNTYRIDGLPPGPISNPGRAALEAVLNPPITSDLYFVADGSGGHAFAETLAEHKKNVAKWREIERGHNSGDAVDELAAEKTGESVEAEKTATPEAVKPKLPEPPIPEGTAVTEPPGPAVSGEQKIVTPELPVIEDQPADQAEVAKPEAGDAPATVAAAPEPAKPAAEPPPKTEPKPQELGETAPLPETEDGVATLPEPPAEAQPKAKPQELTESAPAPSAAEPQPKSQELTESTPSPPAAEDGQVKAKPEPQSSNITEAAPPPPAAKDGADANSEAAVAAADTVAVPLPRRKPRPPPQPGDLLRVADRLVPIPVPKPKLQ